LSIEEIIEESRPSSPIYLRWTLLYQAHPFHTPHTPIQARSSNAPHFNPPLSFPRLTSLGSLTMIDLEAIYQPIYAITSKSSKVTTTSMFLTLSETHLYGFPSIPPSYQSLSGTFYGAMTNPWTSTSPSSYGISSVTPVMIASQLVVSIAPQPYLEQQYGPNVNGMGHLQQPPPPYTRYPPPGGKLPPYTPYTH